MLSNKKKKKKMRPTFNIERKVEGKKKRDIYNCR